MDTTPPNSIEEIDVKNYMRIRKARLIVDGNTIVVSGQNEQGKSSFLDAIQDIFGGKNLAPAMPIRRGATEANVMVRLCADGKKLKAELTHTKGGRRLVVRDEDGNAQNSPQEIMNRFWAETSFDPSLFLISSGPDQKAMLMRLAKLDFATLDTEHKAKFDERTIVNRDAEKKKVEASTKPFYPNAPKAEQSALTISDELETARKHNSQADALRQSVADLKASVETYEQSGKTVRGDITDLEAELKRINEKLATKRTVLASIETSVSRERASLAEAEKAVASFAAMDVAPIQSRLAAVEETNRQVRANATKAAADTAAREKQAEADALTARLEEITEAKAEAIRTAKFPIPGMTIDGDDVVIGGIPLAQESDMRRLAIGVEMAALMNPGKPLMLIRHGNLFTPKNFGILEEIAQKLSLTCIVEIPGTNVAGSKLVFEDGVGDKPGDLTLES